MSFEIGPSRLEVRGSPFSEAALSAFFPDFDKAAPQPAAIAIWRGARGHERARRRALLAGLPLLTLDCGLLRAPPRGRGQTPPLSLTAVALTGPASPADALSPERVLSARGWEAPELLARAAGARRELVMRRVGGSWWNRAPVLPGSDLVLVDCAGITRSSPSPPWKTMLAAALAETRTAKPVVLMPDRRSPRGLFEQAEALGCAIVIGPVDPWAVIDRAARVYTLGGETGFLALAAGRDVRCFGKAFYSGWGATRDAAGVPQRLFRRSFDEIFAGACLVATRYRDPFRNTPASLEELVAILADWRKIEEANRRIAVCVGMSFWKRRRVGDFFWSATDGAPLFRRSARAALTAARARPGEAIAVWASRVPEGLVAATGRARVPLVWIEDGFVRSVGLGADFVPAASLVLDAGGMHYNPLASTDLQQLLRGAEFDDRLIDRARSLIALLVARGITKYNLAASPVSLDLPSDRRRILVPGQVEDDLSVRLNSSEVTGNLDLLRRVRGANPDAFVIYKPHPDVDAGHRKGAIPDRLAAGFADAVLRGVSTAALLREIDELHTLTSLAGFEALLRGRRVVVYGRPFYAGWGLTTDIAGIDRGRRLTLEELVAGALILYPRYLDPVTRLPCPPEVIIERLDQPDLWRPGPLVIARRLQGALSKCWRRPRGLMLAMRRQETGDGSPG